MTIGDALYQHLSADVNIGAFVGSPEPRIFPVQWEQGTAFPLITYGLISNNEGYTHDGWDGTGSMRMQLTAWSDGSAAQAEDLSEAIKSSMRYFDRTARLVSERNTVEPQTNYHQFMQDWMFIWTGTVSPHQLS